MMVLKKLFIIFRISIAIMVLTPLIACHVHAQDTRVNAGFLSDSVRIGERIAFFLTASYPTNQNILFPDSTFSFAPFEFDGKAYFPTETADGVSRDSTVYYLSTFEVDSEQSLMLPVFIVNKADCTVLQSPRDTVALIQLVAEVPDSVSADKLPLIADTAYYKVKFEWNIIIIVIIAAAVLIIALIVWIIFGKRIIRHYRARKLEKRYQEFIQAYNGIINEIKVAFSPATTEKALSLWKKYMEQLEGMPYTKLTTRETLAIQKNETLGNNLKNIDRAIYGHDFAVKDSLDYLKEVASKSYETKFNQVKHGK